VLNVYAPLVQVLGDNLLSLIKLHNYRGIPIPTVKRITRQVPGHLSHGKNPPFMNGRTADICHVTPKHVQLKATHCTAAGVDGARLHPPHLRHHPHRPEARERDAD
jgi:hypothetical protein